MRRGEFKKIDQHCLEAVWPFGVKVIIVPVQVSRDEERVDGEYGSSYRYAGFPSIK